MNNGLKSSGEPARGSGPVNRRRIYRALGGLFFALGTLGIGLPLLPTVPFWILAAWFFARSSPELRDRIYAHPTFGPPVRQFLEHRTLSRRGKIAAVTGITSGVGISILVAQPPLWVIGLIIALLLPVVLWLLFL
jgi:uncharacterized membrane protein YbaN (DUF454 family)